MTDKQKNSTESTNNIIDVLYVVRQGTKANWQSSNIILQKGEIGIVTDYPGVYVVGDGENTFDNLQYVSSNVDILNKTSDQIIGRLGDNWKMVGNYVGKVYANQIIIPEDSKADGPLIVQGTNVLEKFEDLDDNIETLDEKIDDFKDDLDGQIENLKDNLFIIWDGNITSDGHPEIDDTSNITNSIYLVPVPNETNEYIEWIYEESGWRKLSETTVSITYTSRANKPPFNPIGDVNANNTKYSNGIKNANLQTLLEEMLYPYVAPSLTNISVSPSTIPSNENKDINYKIFAKNGSIEPIEYIIELGNGSSIKGQLSGSCVDTKQYLHTKNLSFNEGRYNITATIKENEQVKGSKFTSLYSVRPTFIYILTSDGKIREEQIKYVKNSDEILLSFTTDSNERICIKCPKNDDQTLYGTLKITDQNGFTQVWTSQTIDTVDNGKYIVYTSTPAELNNFAYTFSFI